MSAPMSARVLLVRSITVALAAALAACGGSPASDDDDDPGPAIDAPEEVATVVEVTPCEGETVTVETTGGFRYSPQNSTITVDQIVKFEMDGSHDVNGAASDPGLDVGFGQTKCLRFTAAGVFNFKCTPHGFTGSVTVN